MSREAKPVNVIEVASRYTESDQAHRFDASVRKILSVSAEEMRKR